MLRLQLQLRLLQDDPPSGELSGPDGMTVPFSGRLELLAAVERFAEGKATEQPDAAPTAAESSPTPDPAAGPAVDDG